MKKRATIVSVLFVLALQMSVAMAASAQNVPADRYTGSDWKTVPDLVREFFVIGYAHGYSRGIRLAASLKSVNGKGTSAPQAAMEKLYVRNVHSSNKIVGYDKIEDEMNLFYQDFRNTPVCWGDAELISILALSGGAPSETELDAVRSDDAKEGCPN